MTPSPLDRLLGGLLNVKRMGEGFLALCPAHDDHDPSLSITLGDDGRILLHCFAGCTPERVLDACGLSFRDLFPESGDMSEGNCHEAAKPAEPTAFIYRDEQREPLYRVLRWEAHLDGRKRFAVEWWSGNAWLRGIGSSRRVLYRLPEALEAIRAGRRVYVVEGEKNAEDLVRAGLVATTAAFGAGKWRQDGAEYAQSLAGADAVVLADNDGPGRKHRDDVLRSLYGVARSVRAVDLPDTSEGDDISNWLAGGGTAAELEALADRAPSWSPTSHLLARAKIVCAADVEPEPVRWLWCGRMPRAKIATLDGDPGLAKSTLLLDLAARISVGAALPDSDPFDGPQDVVILSAEDGVADTIVPRLKAAGADLTRIRLLTEVGTAEEARLPELPADIPLLRELVLERRAALVIVDPFMAYLSSGIDSHRDQDVRRAMSQLKSLAEETGAAIVIVRHCTKGMGMSAIHKGGGSVGIIGAARVGLLVAKDPEAPDSDRRIIAVAKSNVGAIPSALAYRSVTAEEYGCGRIQWEGPTGHAADDLAAAPASQEDRGALTEARAFLTDALKDGPRAAGELVEEAKAAGIAERTLKRAKGSLSIPSYKEGVGWMWGALPSPNQGGQASQQR